MGESTSLPPERNAGGGLYWMVPALITGFLTAVTGAWLLLVEIHR